MGLKDLMNEAKGVAGSASDAAGKLVDEFNQALPSIRAVGFTVKDLKVAMGLLPEISAKLVASTDAVDVKKIKEIIDKHGDNKMLVGTLKAVEAAFHLKQFIPDLPCKGVELDMKLGIPPHVDVSFLENAPAAAKPATAAAAAAGLQTMQV